MVDSDSGPDFKYKSLKISFASITKTPEMLRFVTDHLKTKMTIENAVKKLPFIIKYVLDWYKTQEMCDKTILEIGGTLMFVPDCYKNKKCLIKLLIIVLMH